MDDTRTCLSGGVARVAALRNLRATDKLFGLWLLEAKSLNDFAKGTSNRAFRVESGMILVPQMSQIIQEYIDDIRKLRVLLPGDSNPCLLVHQQAEAVPGPDLKRKFC